MKFTHKIFLYKVNEDNTVTFYTFKNEQGKPDGFFRSNARLPLLLELSQMAEHTELVATIGVYYQKGKGLALQIVEVVNDEK